MTDNADWRERTPDEIVADMVSMMDWLCGDPNEPFITVPKGTWDKLLGPDHPYVVVSNALNAQRGARIAARAQQIGDSFMTERF